MKPSVFNYATSLPDSTGLIFNSYTLNLLVLDADERRAAERALAEPPSPAVDSKERDLRQLLVHGGFLIDEEIDELALLRRAREKSCKEAGRLTLTIAPTLDCNLGCIYCYQHRQASRMTPPVESAVLRHAEKHVKAGAELAVIWFGGEPLLELGVIGRLSEGLIEICEQRGATYRAKIITNGLLLDGHTAEKLLGWRISVAQITLDGPQAVHDGRRPRRGGGPSFQRVFDNLIEASDRLTVSLRMNVDERNRESVPEMLELLQKHGLEQRVGFYLGQAYPYTTACADMAGSCISDHDFSLLELETLRDMLERGFLSLFNLPSGADHHCLAESRHSWVITPSGGVARCWNDIHDPDALVGHLDAPIDDSMRARAAEWDSLDPFERDCAECVLLPMCMGGCPYRYRLTGQTACQPWKHHMRESLALYHYVREREQQGQIVKQFQKTVQALKANRREVHPRR